VRKQRHLNTADTAAFEHTDVLRHSGTERRDYCNGAVVPLDSSQEDNNWRFDLSDTLFNFGVNVPGNSLQTGTFTSANSNIAKSEASDGDGGPFWEQTFDFNAESDQRGTFALTIISVGPPVPSFAGTQWWSPQGSLTVTLPPSVGNASTTNVNVNVTF
jgi:hypothetical protein